MESHFYCVISYNKGIIHVTCSRTMHNLLLNIDFINYYCQQTFGANNRGGTAGYSRKLYQSVHLENHTKTGMVGSFFFFITASLQQLPLKIIGRAKKRGKKEKNLPSNYVHKQLHSRKAVYMQFSTCNVYKECELCSLL